MFAIGDPPSNEKEIMEFDHIYNYLIHHNLATKCGKIYDSGLGLTGQGMYEYLEYLLSKTPGIVDSSYETNLIFGFSVPSIPGAILVPTSFSGLISAFVSAKKLINEVVPNPGGPGPII
jgi:hypothetical protein